MRNDILVEFKAISDASDVVSALARSHEFLTLSPQRLSLRSHCATVFNVGNELLAVAGIDMYPEQARLHIGYLEVGVSFREQGHARRLYEVIFAEAAGLGKGKSMTAAVSGSRFTQDGKDRLLRLKQEIRDKQCPGVNIFQIPGGA